LLVYGAFALGQALAGPLAGAGGALVVATMPVLAFQIVQPMNDVLVAALWLCIVALAAQPRDYSGGIGALVGVAVLVRPNLAPAAIVVSIWLAARGWRAFTGFAVAAAPAVAVLLMLNAALYGHPLRTGYGSVAELFAWSYLPANLENYGRALWQTQWAFPLVGLLSVIALPASARRTLAVALSVVLAIGAVYLLYRPFPEWWYLRFLLPALAILAVLAVAAVRHVAPHPAVVVIVVAVVVAAQVRTDAMRDAWRVGQLESRFRTAATVARERLPENAVYLTVWESGSVRYHASRDAVLWDSLAPASLDSAVAWLRASGREPFLMIEDWEEPQFRARFASSSVLGQLDWPPRFDIERRVRIYRFSDRDAYFGGTSIPTEFVLSRHR
jgi:hypothetical protein